MRWLCLMANPEPARELIISLGAAVVPIRVRGRVVAIESENAVHDTVVDITTRKRRGNSGRLPPIQSLNNNLIIKSARGRVGEKSPTPPYKGSLKMREPPQCQTA